MNIQLNFTEISEALVDYISDQGIDINEKEINVSLTAGRGVNKYSANVTIMPGDTVKKSSKGKPAKVTSTPNLEEDNDDTEEVVEIPKKPKAVKLAENPLPNNEPVDDSKLDDDKSLFGTKQ